MTHVATLVFAPGTLDDTAVRNAAMALPGATAITILSAGEAVDIRFTPDGVQDHRVFVERLRAGLAAPVDILVQPEAGRRKKLLLADMGLHHDRSGMYRRAGGLCRLEGACRGDHRACHARRHRV